MFEFYRSMTQVQKGFTILLGTFIVLPILFAPLSYFAPPKDITEENSGPSQATLNRIKLTEDISAKGAARLPLEVVLELAAQNDVTLFPYSAQRKTLGVKWSQSDNANLLNSSIELKKYNDVMSADGLSKSRCKDAPALSLRSISSEALDIYGSAQVFECMVSLPCEFGAETYSTDRELVANIIHRRPDAMCAIYNRLEEAEVAFINSFGRDNINSRRIYVVREKETGAAKSRLTLSIMSFGCDVTWERHTNSEPSGSARSESFGSAATNDPSADSSNQVEVTKEFTTFEALGVLLDLKPLQLVVPKSSLMETRSECIVAVTLESFEGSTTFGESDSTEVGTTVIRFWSDLPVHYSIP